MTGKSGTIPSLARDASRNYQASQKSLPRRVSFSDTQLNRSKDLDSEGQPQYRGKFSSRCNMCCAWVSITLGTLLIILFIFGVVFFAFLQSNLPEFRIQRLDVYKLNTTNSKNKETSLTGEFEIHVNATNKNKKIVLHYGTMDVSVSAEDISLGGMQIPAFEQNVETGKDLKVRIKVSKSPMNEDDAKELVAKSNDHTMVIDLSFIGKITFVINGNEMSGLPLKVSCQGIEQSDIDQGLGPVCNVRITPFS